MQNYCVASLVMLHYSGESLQNYNKMMRQFIRNVLLNVKAFCLCIQKNQPLTLGLRLM